MQLESKFNLGDKFFFVLYNQKYCEIKCTFCNGDGSIKSNYNELLLAKCPKCYGTGKIGYREPIQWYCTKKELTIGEIRVEERKNGYHKESYMAEETGIGSGNVYEVSKMFKTIEEAQEWCDKENNKEQE